MPNRVRWVYITGCDSGFGRQLCEILDHDKAGNWGVIAGVYAEASKHAIRSSLSQRVVPVQVDITNDASVAAAAAVVKETVGPDGLFGLVNNAGILVAPGPVEFTPSDAYRKMFEVNVIGMAAVTRSVLPYVRRAQGRIINVASIAGRVGLPGQPAYCASKFAVEGFSDVLRKDMAPWGVTVHIVEPGIFKQTGLYGTWEKGFRDNWDNADAAVRADYGEKWLERGVKGLGGSLKFSNSDPSIVPKAMFDALSSDAPTYRYRCGFDSKYAVTLIEKLHEASQDSLMPNTNVNTVLPVNAPKNGVAIASARYKKDRKLWYLFGLGVAGYAFKMRSKF